MADVKISALNSLTNVDSSDVLVINDVSAGETKQTTVTNVLNLTTRNVYDSGDVAVVRGDLVVNNEIISGGDITTETGTIGFGSLKDLTKNILVTQFVKSDQVSLANITDSAIPTFSAVAEYVSTFGGGSGSGYTDIIPLADSTYDLGDSVTKWKDLYLSGSSIYLGDHIIRQSGTNLEIQGASAVKASSFIGDGSSLTNITAIGVDSSANVSDVTYNGDEGFTTVFGDSDDKIKIVRIDSNGTVDRNLNDRLMAVVSPDDFGAVGDGITDDTEALKAMLRYVFNRQSPIERFTGVSQFVDEATQWDSGEFQGTDIYRGFVEIRFPARRAYKITDTIDFGGGISYSRGGLQGGCQVKVDFNNSEFWPAPNPVTGKIPSALRMHGDKGRFMNLMVRYEIYNDVHDIYEDQPTGIFLCPDSDETPTTYASNSYVTYDTIQVFDAYRGFELQANTVGIFKGRFIQCDAKRCLDWGYRLFDQAKVGTSTTTMFQQCHVSARLVPALYGRARQKESFTATAGQTVFNYNQEFLYLDDPIVRVNDVKIDRGTDSDQYLVSLDSSSITLNTPASSGDVIDIYGVYECLQTHVPDADKEPGIGVDWKDYWWSVTNASDISARFLPWDINKTRYYEDGKGYFIRGMGSTAFVGQCCIDGTNNRESGNGMTLGPQFGFTIKGGFHWEAPKLVSDGIPLVSVQNASLHVDHIYLPAPYYINEGDNVFFGGTGSSRLCYIEEMRNVDTAIDRGEQVFVDASAFGIVKTGTGIGDDQVKYVNNMPSANVHGSFDVQRLITHRPMYEAVQQNYGGTNSTVTPETGQSGTTFYHNVTQFGSLTLDLTGDPQPGSFFKAFCINTLGGKTGDVNVISSDNTRIYGPTTAINGETLVAFKTGFSYWYTWIEPTQNYGNFVDVDNLVVGQEYQIHTLGNTTQEQWNIIAGTSGDSYSVNDTIIPVAQDATVITGDSVVGTVRHPYTGNVKLSPVGGSVLPDADMYEGKVLRYTNDSAYGEVIAYSDGSDWIRVNDLQTVNSPILRDSTYFDSAAVLPTATDSNRGKVLRFTQDSAYGEVIVFSNGSDWIRVNDLKSVHSPKVVGGLDSSVFFIDSVNQRVGIYDSNPTATLSVISQTDNTVAKFQSNDPTVVIELLDSGTSTAGSGPTFVSRTTDQTSLYSGGSVAIFMDSNQFVGIKNTSPDVELTVSGDIRSRFSTNYTDVKNYGLEINRSNAYIRPTEAFDKTSNLLVGNTNNNWNIVSFSFDNKFELADSDQVLFRVLPIGDVAFFDDAGVENSRWDASSQAFAVGKTSADAAYGIDVAGAIKASTDMYADTAYFGDSSYETRITATPSTGLLELNSNAGVIRNTAGNITFQTSGTTGRVVITSGDFSPVTDSDMFLGTSIKKWKAVYASNGTIQTSDRNYKQQITELDSAELAVAVKIKPLIRKFKFNDAVDKKGDGARWHVGIIAQDLEEAFISEGLDPFEYGVLCYDEWWEKEVFIEPDKVYPEGRTETQTFASLEEAPEDAVKKSIYSIRYDELMAFVISVI